MEIKINRKNWNHVSKELSILHLLLGARKEGRMLTLCVAGVVVQSPSRVQLFVTPWTAACQDSLSLTISWSLPKSMSIDDVIQPSHALSPSSPLPSIFPSNVVGDI